MFRRGYADSNEEKKNADRKYGGAKLYEFWLSDEGDEGNIVFLTEEPVSMYIHVMKEGKRFNTYLCPQDETCPYCEDGDKPQYNYAYMVIDRREYEYTDNKGNKQTGQDQIRMLRVGYKVYSQIERLFNKYGILYNELTMIRLGVDKQTAYTFERGEELEIDEEYIAELLPEWLKDEYDGTTESLMTIIENEYMKLLPAGSHVDEDDEGDEEEPPRRGVKSAKKPAAKTRTIEPDDDEDDEPPKKSGIKKKSSGGVSNRFRR